MCPELPGHWLLHPSCVLVSFFLHSGFLVETVPAEDDSILFDAKGSLAGRYHFTTMSAPWGLRFFVPLLSCVMSDLCLVGSQSKHVDDWRIECNPESMNLDFKKTSFWVHKSPVVGEVDICLLLGSHHLALSWFLMDSDSELAFSSSNHFPVQHC